jgi:hypothetical protein
MTAMEMRAHARNMVAANRDDVMGFWIISNLNEFRRVISKVATVVIFASILLSPTLILFPYLQAVRVGFVVFYLLLALIVRLTIWRSAPDSLFAIRVIEIVCFAALLTTALWTLVLAWADGAEELGLTLVRVTIDASVLIVVALWLRRNVAIARSMALESQNLSSLSSRRSEWSSDAGPGDDFRGNSTHPAD